MQPTTKLRWIHIRNEGAGSMFDPAYHQPILEQEWVDAQTGRSEWRAVPNVYEKRIEINEHPFEVKTHDS